MPAICMHLASGSGIPEQSLTLASSTSPGQVLNNLKSQLSDLVAQGGQLRKMIAERKWVALRVPGWGQTQQQACGAKGSLLAICCSASGVARPWLRHDAQGWGACLQAASRSCAHPHSCHPTPQIRPPHRSDLQKFDSDLTAVSGEKTTADRSVRRLKAEQDDM